MFALLQLLLIVAMVSHWETHETVSQLSGEILEWLLFTIPGSPNINSFPKTTTIIAGVTWSLPYEWLFYFSLPILGLLITARSKIACVLISATLILMMLNYWEPDLSILSCFLGGVAAAFIARFNFFRKIAKSPASSFIALTSLVYVATSFSSTYTKDVLIPMSISFILIASGSSIFGLLTLPVSRTLGEMAYSIYLLHGLVLFTTYHFLVGIDLSRSLTTIQHWLLILGLSPIVVCLAFLTYRSIEMPCMRIAKKYRSA